MIVLQDVRSTAQLVARSWAGLAILILLTALFLALTKHATVFVGIILAIAITLNLFAYPPTHACQAQIHFPFKGYLFSAALFVTAIVLALPTAFAPSVHLAIALKVAVLQLIVLGAFLAGRALTNVTKTGVLRWTMVTLVLATLLLVEEQTWHALRKALNTELSNGSFDLFDTNRSFLTISLALSFTLLASRQTKSYVLMLANALLMAVIFIYTASESARLVIVGSALLFLMPQWALPSLFSVVLYGAIAWVAIGPFVYEHLLSIWNASPLQNILNETFQYRLRIWADTSALILESNFLGRGMSALETIAEKRDLFEMPHDSYGWHPHNAGLQVAVDLGIPGMLWLGLVLLKVRSHILTSVRCYQSGLMATCLMFLTVSFLADGFWQSWWWALAAIIAAWIGVLSTPIVVSNGAKTTQPAFEKLLSSYSAKP